MPLSARGRDPFPAYARANRDQDGLAEGRPESLGLGAVRGKTTHPEAGPPQAHLSVAELHALLRETAPAQVPAEPNEDTWPEQSRRLWAAMMLARDVYACEALLLGEDVPKHRLDPLWTRRLQRIGG